MAEETATQSSRRHCTIGIPLAEEAHSQLVNDPIEFRRAIKDCFRRMPELFPANFAHGYRLKAGRSSASREVLIRRIVLRDGTAYSIRPSFLLPYLTACTEEVEGPLVLRTAGGPLWALARVFGNDAMFWFRLEGGLGRFSIVGTTVGRAGLPKHLVAEEHHHPLDGQKVYIATTVDGGCCRGAEPATAAGTDVLKVASETFQDEARGVSPEYAPETVGTDGWKGTQAAWRTLFPKVVILLCFMHAWLKVRDRAQHRKGVVAEVSRRAWEAYHAPDRRRFAQRRLWQWAAGVLRGGAWRPSWTSVTSVRASRSRTAMSAAIAPATCSTGSCGG